MATEQVGNSGSAEGPHPRLVKLVQVLGESGLGPLEIRRAIIEMARRRRSDRQSLFGEPPELPEKPEPPTEGAEL